MTSEVTQRIFLLPKNQIEGKYSIICLKHPKSGSIALCALDSYNKLYEIVHFKDEFSSWFVEDSVAQDGSLYILTVADPLFFILPYVNQDQKFCPLEDLLVDGDFPDIHNLLKCCSSNELSHIFDTKESSGFKVFCYNNTKTLHWLQQKVKYLSSSLKNKNISITDGSKSASLQTNDENENPDDTLQLVKQCADFFNILIPEDKSGLSNFLKLCKNIAKLCMSFDMAMAICERHSISQALVQITEILLNYACHLISDYITEELSIELFKSLGLKMKQEKPKNEDNSQGKAKKQNTSVSPTDDYSKNFSMTSLQEKQKTKLSSAQKQLMKVDKKGMKSISSFFQKK